MKRAASVVSRALMGGIFAAIVGTSVPARAQTPSEIAAAKQWFAEGLKLENSGDWKGALERFRRAADVKKTASIEFHVGLCEEHTGQLVLAMIDLERAVSLAHESGAKDVESASQAELADVRGRTPTLEVDVPAGASPKSMTVDGTAVALATIGSPMPIDPGDHHVEVEFASGKVARKVRLAERDTAKVAFEPPAGAASVTPVPVAPPPSYARETSTASDARDPARDSSPETKHGSSTLGWILVGAGAAVTIGGVVFWTMRSSEISTLDSACPSRAMCDAALQSHDSAGKTDTVVSLALLTAGVAGMGIGAGVLVFGHDGPSSAAGAPSARIVPAPGGAMVVGKF